MTDPYGQPPQDPFATPPPTNPYAQTPPPAPPQPPAPPVAPGYGAPTGAPYGQPSAPPYSQSTPPYGQPPVSPYGQQYAYATAQPPQNSMALVSMILSLVGLLTVITAPIGAILGHVAMNQIKQTGESGEGMAKAGIIIGWIVTGLYVLSCCGLFLVPVIIGAANA